MFFVALKPVSDSLGVFRRVGERQQVAALLGREGERSAATSRFRGHPSGEESDA